MKDMHQLTPTAFIADFETGTASGTAETDPNPPTLFMRYSKDGGGSFKNNRSKTLISAGNYRSLMRWRGLGTARDWVFELSWSYNGPSALQGAYLEVIEHGA